MSTRRTYPCFQCEKNGFPNEQVLLSGKDPQTGKTIYLNPKDESPHIHKNKLGGQQQTVPMTQPLSGQTTKEQSIQNMHDENQRGYTEYRLIMKAQVDATNNLAEAIRNDLAMAINNLALATRDKRRQEDQ